MKCLETEELMSYVYRLMDETAASEVRAHLGECPGCREIVEQHKRLDTVLGEWKVPQPTPAFDVRVRQAVEAHQVRREAWSFWGLGWARSLVLASLGVLIVAGVVWFARSHSSVSNISRIVARQFQKMSGDSVPSQVAKVRDPAVSANAGMSPAEAAQEPQSAIAASAEDSDTQALEDYDLAANFDILSEIPKGETRVAN